MHLCGRSNAYVRLSSGFFLCVTLLLLWLFGVHLQASPRDSVPVDTPTDLGRGDSTEVRMGRGHGTALHHVMIT